MITRAVIDTFLAKHLIKARKKSKYDNVYYIDKKLNGGKIFNCVIFFNTELPKKYENYLLSVKKNDKTIITVIDKANWFPRHFLTVTTKPKKNDMVLAGDCSFIVLRNWFDELLGD